MTSCAQALVQLLEGYGVETVFGIPGVHTVELYRGLAGSRLRHLSPRHEQGPASWPTATPAPAASRACASSSPARA